MTGKNSRMEKMRTEDALARLPKGGEKLAMHPGPDPGWVEIPVEHTPPTNKGVPTYLPFGYSNGGEFRKTYHGLAPPFAQLIESPTQAHITPMQIDTWNRAAMNITGSKFVAGPAPKHSFAPTTGVDAIYSGLLECPLTTRLRKEITGGGFNDTFRASLDTCATPIDSAATCFAVGKEIGLAGAKVVTSQGDSDSQPAGCSVQVNSTGTHLFFNTKTGSAAGCGAGVDAIEGKQESLVTLSLTLDSIADEVTITMSGPSGNWFGVGFDTQYMSNSP